jgi:hypothetical protein
MDRRFAAEEWEQMTNFERTERCHTMAREAVKLAETAPPNLAEGYLHLAEQWLRLAVEISRDTQHVRKPG